MRLFLSLILLTTLSAHAQQPDIGNGTIACDETTDFTNGGTFECATLDIDNAGIIAPFDLNAPPLIIKVRGDVNINAPFILSGENGQSYDTITTTHLGGQGGPGAGNGGGDDGSGARFDSNDFINPVSDSRGLMAPFDGVCGNGGGGGSFATAVVLVATCAGSTNPPGTTGQIVDGGEFSLPTPFRGGFGGGAGGDGPSLSYGSGGGGGGAIKIIAGGDITISATGSILANGGDGGDGNTDGGGGGAGSGGVIWLQSLGGIIFDGSMDALGGTGGTAAAGAVGGTGGRGVIRLEDLDGIISGGAIPPAYATSGAVPSIAVSQSLKSSIACGMIKADDKNHSAFFQIGLGFALIMLLSMAYKKIRILFQDQDLIS